MERLAPSTASSLTDLAIGLRFCQLVFGHFKVDHGVIKILLQILTFEIHFVHLLL